ncbi:hypothetical protein ACFQ0G_53475 [Streptomyces chiangmaiensis]|uniref:hypothetical protein n=1 Tax=Streptomyces chiangmaiensis TaxID=766497 RepID=UPI0031EE74DB
METVNTLIAQIRRNITDSVDATAMMFDARAACDREGWGPALDALSRTDTPLLLDGIRYDTVFNAANAIDAAAHAVWDGVRDLFEPEIEAEAEATADQVIEARTKGVQPDLYLSTMRYWQRACHPQDVYPIPLGRIAIWEHFRDASKALITHVVQLILHHAVTAMILKDQLTADHYRALTWPFDDLTDSSTSEER